jgi:hypothetical protein
VAAVLTNPTGSTVAHVLMLRDGTSGEDSTPAITSVITPTITAAMVPSLRMS